MLSIAHFAIVQWMSIQRLQMTIFILITGRRCHRRQVHQSHRFLYKWIRPLHGKYIWMVAVWVTLKVQCSQTIVFRIEICFRILFAIYTFIRKCHNQSFFYVVYNLLAFHFMVLFHYHFLSYRNIQLMYIQSFLLLLAIDSQEYFSNYKYYVYDIGYCCWYM